MNAIAGEEQLEIRVHGDPSLPTLVYLPGLHGDWTLVSSLRHALQGQVRFVEFTYPRSFSWSLEEYALRVNQALAEHGITNGWLLGESFGSQIVWPLATMSTDGKPTFHVEGIILAGGFVRHPNIPGIGIAKQFIAHLPDGCFHACLSLYAKYARLRHRHAPETLDSIDEFVRRRTPLDRQAMKHRLGLIRNNDPRSTVRRMNIPVYALSGFWDPIVPRVITRMWLQKHCRGYRNAKTIWMADHNVLGTQPQKSAEVILSWIKADRKQK